MNGIILTCKCGDTPKFAEESFHLLFPDLPTPKPVSGSAISTVADSLSAKSEAARYIRGLIANKERYAIYLSWDLDGNILSAYNLLTGRKMQ